TVDDLVALLAKEAQYGQTDGHVPADKAAAFEQADLQPVFGCADSGGDSGGSAADDEHVILGAYWDLARRFENGRLRHDRMAFQCKRLGSCEEGPLGPASC